MPGCTYTYNATSAGPVTWTVTPNTATVVNAGNSIQVTWPSNFTNGYVIATAMQDSCTSVPDTLAVDTVSKPTITGGGNLCSNGQNSFSVSSLPANTTIQWTVSPSTAGSVTSGQGTQNATVTWYTVTTSTPVTVTATIINGCTNANFAVLNASGTLYPEPAASVSGNLLFCSGSSTTITATGGGTYLWDGSFSGTSHSFNTAGQHNVEVTNSFGCKKKIYFTLVEVPSPVVTLSTTTAVQCSGSALLPFTLATTVGSGYTVTNYTFKDPSGTTLCSSTTPSCTVSSPTAGTYTVTVTFSYTYNGSPVSCTKTASLAVACPTTGSGSGSGCSSNPTNCHYTITYSYQNCNSIQLTINPFPACGTFSPPDTISLDWGDGNSTNIYSSYDTTTHTYILTHTYSLLAYYHLFLDCNLGSIDIPVGGVVNFSLVHDTCSIDLLDFSSAITGATFTFTSINWGDGNTNTSTTHVYANSGTYTVTLTYNLNGNPCTATQTITVIKPTFTINANPNPACAGSPVSFSVNYSSPFTSSNVASFDWDFGDTSAHSHDSVTQHSYTFAGTHTVTLTIKDIYGCVATKTISLTTIAPVAYTLTSNSPQCDSVTMTINTPSGFGNPVSVVWTPATVDSLGSYQYSDFTSGSYTAVVTDPNGCKVNLSKNIMVYPKPNIKIITSDSLCTGQTYLITNNGSTTQFSFGWQINGISTAYSQSGTGANISFTPTTAGTYEIVLTATLTSSPFCAATIKDTVTVFGSPVVTVTPSTTSLVCSGTPITMNTSVTGNSPYTYSWNTGQTADSIVVYINGNYTVIVTDVNWCKGKATGTANISPLPDFSVFVHGCDTLCFDGQDTIHGPLGYSNYQFLIDNVTVQNGSSPYFIKPCSQTAMQDGAPHTIELIITTAFSCVDSSKFQLKCKNCNICACDTSVHFNSSPYVSYFVGENKKSDSSICNSEKSLQLDCNKKYEFAISLVYPSSYDSCHVKDSVVLINNSGTVVASQISVTPSNPLSFAFTTTGHYCITHYLKVNGKVCDSCRMCIDVNCSRCQCNPEIHFSSKPYVSYAIGPIRRTDSTTCNSEAILKLECKRSYQFAIALTVPSSYDTCKIGDSAVITDGLGSVVTSMNGVTPSNPLSYTFTQSGTYCITFYLKVNGTVCDSCRFCATVSCPIPPSCNNCSKILNSSYFELNDTIRNSNGYQVQTGNINFSLLANAQEVKMSIADIEYSWTDNKCQDCHMHTIGRGCLYATSSTQTIGGLILDPNSAQFLPLGSKPDECPEEVIWTMGTYANAGTYNVPIQFSLPQGLIPTCCSLKVTKLCIRLSIKDVNCLVCDTVICFTVRPACCKGSKWQSETMSWSGIISDDPSSVGSSTSTEKVTNTLSVVCGQTYTIADGITYTFNATYMCNPADNCKPKMKVRIKQPGGATTLNNMPVSKSFTTPGTYTVTYYAICGNTICDSCIFNLFLPKNCCKNSKWLSKTVTFKKSNGNTQTKNLNDGDVVSSAVTTTVAVSYQCGQDCSPTYGWKRWRNNAALDSGTMTSTSGTATVSFAPPSSGCDSIVITAYCGGKPCATLSFTHCCINCIKVGANYNPLDGYKHDNKPDDKVFYSFIFLKKPGRPGFFGMVN
jgi:PKD repeat protein